MEHQKKNPSTTTTNQRRQDAAVCNIGVIESGYVPDTTQSSLHNPRRTARTTGRTGTSDSIGDTNRSGRSGSCASRGQLRTNRRLTTILGRKISGQDNVEIASVVEGRAKVLLCEVVEHTRSNALRRARRPILHPMRVDVPPGSVTAILGTAESGKSTLLKFLAGCMDSNVEFEGVVNLPGSKSYLPKETYLHRFYTPRTYIEHYDRLLSARHGGFWCTSNNKQDSRTIIQDDNASSSAEAANNTRDGACTTSSANNHRASSASSFMTTNDIENLLDSLRIDHDRRDTIVGDAFKRGLNPGEQRRLELGLLVLGSPDTLFCENPVSGLDSETSLHVMEFLKGYISNNSTRRVILTLNRPSPYIWNLIDNVILLSKGRIVFEGPRFDMENFFAFHKMPTPKRMSPLEHYLAVISNFRRPDVAVNWESAFKQWQEEADEDEEDDDLADDIETCFPSSIPDVIIPRIGVRDRIRSGPSYFFGLVCCCGGWGHKFIELLHRYLLNMIFNPGILLIRLVMYTFLSLLLGALFYNLEVDESYKSTNSHAALLFYSSSFYIFMVVAVLPFLAHDQNIRDKEILNGFYHPFTHHLAVTVASIPSVLILALVITGILVGMVKLNNASIFFSILTLALWCAESYAFLMSYCVKNYILAIVCLAGVFGLSMPLEGFMLVPSKFPVWLQWSYHVPFHTFAWRSFMHNEFMDIQLGEAVLESYDIEKTNIAHDMVVLFCYSMVIHLACLGVLLIRCSSHTMAQKMKES